MIPWLKGSSKNRNAQESPRTIALHFAPAIEYTFSSTHWYDNQTVYFTSPTDSLEEARALFDSKAIDSAVEAFSDYLTDGGYMTLQRVRMVETIVTKQVNQEPGS